MLSNPIEIWRLSPIVRLPRVGAIATMPSRLHSFRDAFPTIMRQVHRLCVYLDGH